MDKPEDIWRDYIRAMCERRARVRSGRHVMSPEEMEREAERRVLVLINDGDSNSDPSADINNVLVMGWMTLVQTPLHQRATWLTDVRLLERCWRQTEVFRGRV